jgi:nucleotide-binding universal stress UspA family protein
MSENTPLSRRVVIGLEESAECRSGLETAARLASALAVELHGIFVEDSELLAAAGLPITSLIGYEGGERQTIDAAAMRRSLKVRAQALRDRLKRVAAAHGVAWSFETRQGFVAEQLLDYTNPGDILALGASGRLRQGVTVTSVSRGAACAVLVASRGVRRGGVLLLSTGGPDAFRMAMNLADTFRIPLVVQPLSEDARESARALVPHETSVSVRLEAPEAGTSDLLDARLAYDTPAFLVADKAAAEAVSLDPAEAAARPGLSGVLIVRTGTGS